MEDFLIMVSLCVYFDLYGVVYCDLYGFKRQNTVEMERIELELRVVVSSCRRRAWRKPGIRP